jgi:hypothetical protein
MQLLAVLDEVVVDIGVVAVNRGEGREAVPSSLSRVVMVG